MSDKLDAVIDSPDEYIELNAQEALFAFCGWLTTRKETTTMGGAEECGVVAELIKKFSELNDFEEPREGWEKGFVMPNETDFGKARDLMWDAFKDDPEFKATYEANVACILMDNIPGLKRGEKAYERRNELATLIMDRIFSG